VFKFDKEEATKWSENKLSPQYKKNLFGKTKTNKETGEPIIKYQHKDAGYAEIIQSIKDESGLKVVVKNMPPPFSVTGNSDPHGTVLGAANNSPENSNNTLFVFYNEPNEAHGGNNKHVLLEELYHVKQILESPEWKEERSLPDFTAEMEVEAKEFAAEHGDNFETYYEMEGMLSGWNHPTEMGIISGKVDLDIDVSKADYLNKVIDIKIWTKDGKDETGKTQKRSDNIPHKPLYPNLN
jgi:hypothetical protein